MFAASGTGAMESAVANLVRPGEPALVASCGKFGERWAELCDAYGAATVHYEAGWGNKVEPAEPTASWGRPPAPGVVFTSFSETSTGVVNDVQALAEVAHRHGALLAVDAVSGIGAVPLPQDDWARGRGRVGLAEGADVARRGSRSRARARPRSSAAAERAAGRYYFDWQRTMAGQRKDPPDSPSPPRSASSGARRCARLIEEEGLEKVVRAPPPARPRHAHRRGRSTSICSAPRTRTPTW